MLPFTREQFLDVFVRYNAAFWPVAVLAGLGAAGMMIALARRQRSADRSIAAGLAAMWLWTGVAYHALNFTGINRAAWVFAVLFVVEALALFRAGAWRGRLRFDTRSGVPSAVGWALMAYALVVYPMLGWWLEGDAGAAPLFGITPCPLTLFTLGILSLGRPAVPWSLLAIPIAWSLVGGTAAFLLRIPQDWPLLFSGIIVLAVALRNGGAALPSHP